MQQIREDRWEETVGFVPRLARRGGEMADTRALRALVRKGHVGWTPTRGTRGVVQLVECAVWDREVSRSNRLTPTKVDLKVCTSL